MKYFRNINYSCSHSVFFVASSLSHSLLLTYTHIYMSTRLYTLDTSRLRLHQECRGHALNFKTMKWPSNSLCGNWQNWLVFATNLRPFPYPLTLFSCGERHITWHVHSTTSVVLNTTGWGLARRTCWLPVLWGAGRQSLLCPKSQNVGPKFRHQMTKLAGIWSCFDEALLILSQMECFICQYIFKKTR